MSWRRSRRVRLHLVDRPGVDLPRVEGLLVSRRHGEYLVGVPELLFAKDGNPVAPEGRFVAVPAANVAFLEVL